ncbi:ATP-dependent DNA helicase DinG [Ectobacillus sp. JY-23]|uniref:ATP-dependent DNA helicase DinG n=1 Tax=Ectobacillus sp. JY-23 TaxID=2933872 RepID=UPI001FF2CA5D|nr:ATP-dependent DNA helicase DinG [Ectobacillus sp. JY-23]UOY94455.1 ATP-dependent DNA helicase DinG [Ectobacillus sp. JY-23]
MGMKYVVVDLETTGNGAKGGIDKITEFAAVVIENGEIQEVLSTFVNPGKSIPPFISELTGIYDEMVSRAPSFADIAPMIADLLEDAYFVAHNVHFDWGFLREEFIQAGQPVPHCPVIDTVELARILFPTAESYKLSDLAKQFQLQHDNPHRADSDAMVTGELFLILCEKLKSLPYVTLCSLHELSRGFQTDLEQFISFYILHKEQTPYEQHYDIQHGIALKKYISTKSFYKESISFSAYLAEVNTNLQLKMKAFEPRTGQMLMMQKVHEAFIEDRVCLIEAGTGTGKTLGYLIPALFHAVQEEEPVLVSTQTVQLQQQILDKEIPLLEKILPFSFKVAVMKGRKHYLCLHKFEQALLEEDKNYDSLLTKAKILVWLLQTETGDVDELNLPSGGRFLWDRICNTGAPSMRWENRCFYKRAQHQVYFADLVITNHAFLFHDTYKEDALFKSYSRVILDEAHHIEETASQALGEKFSCLQFQATLSRIGTLETEGALTRVSKRLETTSSLFKEINYWLKEIKFESDELFRMLRAFLFEKQGNIDTVRLVQAYDAQMEKGKLWRAIREAVNRLSHSIDKIMKIYTVEEPLSVVYEDLQNALMTLEKQCEILKRLLTQKLDGVTWMEADVKGTLHSTILYHQPTDVRDVLAERFFTSRKSVILTSATMTVKGNFDYMMHTLGLSSFLPTTLYVPPPFSYKNQVSLMIPTDLPHVNEVSFEEYTAAMVTHIIEIAATVQGRILVLCTSYDMQKRLYTEVKDSDTLPQFAVLNANAGSRNRVVKNFQQFEKAILFGTSSLWEGVDIPLDCLIMVRLPFAPPNDPVMRRKSQALREAGENPFSALSLPQAIIRFKQGFGRLIRKESDRGLFFVLDRRIATKSYGKDFLASLPELSVYEKSLQELLCSIKE